MLVAHADSDYEEWGASATARLDPGERGRGLSLSLSPTIGAASSASERLWAAPDGGAFTPGRGLAAEAGYGLALFGDRFTGTPNIGFGMSDGGQLESEDRQTVREGDNDHQALRGATGKLELARRSRRREPEVALPASALFGRGRGTVAGVGGRARARGRATLRRCPTALPRPSDGNILGLTARGDS